MTTRPLANNENVVDAIKQEILKTNSLDVDKDKILSSFDKDISSDELDQSYVVAQLQLLEDCKRHLFEIYKWFNVQLKHLLGNEANTGPFDSKILGGRVQATIYVYVAGTRVADVIYHFPEDQQEDQPYIFFIRNIKGTETAQLIEKAAQQGLDDASGKGDGA